MALGQILFTGFSLLIPGLKHQKVYLALTIHIKHCWQRSSAHCSYLEIPAYGRSFSTHVYAIMKLRKVNMSNCTLKLST